MTIAAIVRGSRLYSCLSTDTKPEGWAPGILLLETDTGVWWITGEDRRWMPCYPTMAAFQALLTRAMVLETEMAAAKAEIAILKSQGQAQDRTAQTA